MSVFRSRTLIRITGVHSKGVTAVISGWDPRRIVKLKSFPPHWTADITLPHRCFAIINLKGKNVNEFDLEWCG